MGTIAAQAQQSAFDSAIKAASDLIWGWGMIGMILAVGIYLTIRTRFVQIRHLGRALKYTVKNEKNAEGETSSFGALCTALSATIGTGNIVGVATAVTAGGPGALLWMVTAAFFGMATKYAEGLLAVKYRRETRPGRFLGGPFCYIEMGLGKSRKWLAECFAFAGAMAGVMGIGTIVQVNGITSAVNGIVDPTAEHTAFCIGDYRITWAAIVTGLIVTVGAAAVIIGGIRRIAKVSGVVVPFMAATYILFAVIILAVNIRRLPDAILLIFRSAFDPSAVHGAISGLMIKTVIRMGVGRGIFSNEAGLGSAPIAAASAKTRDPARQGLVSMIGTFIDTIVICTMTGLTIIVTGAWDPSVTGAALTGVDVTAYAWRHGLPFGRGFSSAMLAMCLAFFAFTTILGWNHYGEKCVEYLSGGNRRAIRAYRFMYIAAVLVGPYLTASAVWNIADIFNGLMALPNLTALIMLAKTVSRETEALDRRLRSRR